jgi:hypothetical protein
MEEILVRQSAWQIALVLAILMLVAWRVGLRMGNDLRDRNRRARWSKFDDASLALLGLLVAFTFGMSISRHDDRRLMVIRDSNAIGDFYTCASLLNEPVKSKLQTLIREYTELRLRATRTIANQQHLEEVIKQSQQMQDQMTVLAGEALRQGTPIAVPLTNTLNQLISVHAERIGAIENSLPASIAFLLMVSAVVATMLVGREQGFESKTEVSATLSFILMVTLAVYVTLDLNQPRMGMITVSQAPIARVLSTMNAPAAK